MIIQKFGSKLKVFPWFKKKHMTSFRSVRHEEIYGKRMWDSENNTDCSYRQIRCFYKAQAFHRHIVSMKGQFTDKVNTGTKQTQKWQNEAMTSSQSYLSLQGTNLINFPMSLGYLNQVSCAWRSINTQIQLKIKCVQSFPFSNSLLK